jgi:hypothetical protein
VRFGLRAVLTILVLGVAGALLWRAFGSVDARAALQALAHAGPYAPLALLPFLAGMTVDAVGMRVLLGAMGRTAPLARLLPIRIATEALHLTAPAGFVVADSATAALLDAQCSVPLREGAVLAVARKWLVTRSHTVYILLGAGLGFGALAEISDHCLHASWLPWAVGASAIAPLSISIGLGAGFRGGAVVSRVRAFVARLPWPALRARAMRWNAVAVATDACLARIGQARGATQLAAAAFMVCWLLESTETALLCRLVGAPIDFVAAMAIEVGLSLVRSIGNVAPVSLGLTDAGYATLLPAIGVPTDHAAAFVLLKRGKELVWIAIGYLWLAAMRRGGAAARAERPLADASPTPG